MFYGCTNLNYVKSLFTDEYSEKTTYSWLSGVSPYRYVRQEQRRYLDSKINGVNPTKNGIYCLNVSFFTRFRRLISNFCVKFYLNVYLERNQKRRLKKNSRPFRIDSKALLSLLDFDDHSVEVFDIASGNCYRVAGHGHFLVL